MPRPLDCRIYLTADARLAPAALESALEAGPVACVLLTTGGLDEAALRRAVDALRPAAQEREVAFLIENLARVAHETGCDGVHLSAADASVRSARQEVGAEAIVGVGCGASRHAAIVAAEAGADYVAFGGGSGGRPWDEAADPDLLGWWQAVMTAPCVGIAGETLEAAAGLAAAGADFVAVGSAVWSHPAGPGAAVDELLALLANAEA